MEKMAGTKPKNVLLPASVGRRLRRLLSQGPLRTLRRGAARRGLRTWIVGGAPRDLWLNRPILDVDVAVDGEALALATDLARLGAGRLVRLSADPPRVYRLAGRNVELDLAEIERGSILADLGRRDFTVNAIALPLLGGPPLDPFEGLQDLEALRLRAVAAANFADDPLRTLRAPRFMATHGLVPDRTTLSICRRAAPGLSDVAPERIRTELTRLLEAVRAAPALAWAARAGILSPALGRPVSRAVARRFARRGIPCDHPAVLRLAPDERRRVRLAQIAAALSLSPAEAARWLAARRWSRAEAGAAARVLELARDAGLAGDTDPWRWIRQAGPLAAQALALLAASGKASRMLSARLARRLRSRRRVPRFAGSDVMAWTGIAPGPEVGWLLEELEVAALAGRIRTRREGRKWLLARAPAIIRSS
jgi:tRNA nucleotidyltransferase/poly(A) polymerase